jgi:hypothetical protein
VRMPPSCHPSHLVHHPGEASIAASSQTVRILVLAAAASQKFRSSDHCGVQRSAARAAMSTGAPARVRRALMVWRGVQRGTWRAMHRMQLQVADHYESLTALSLFLFIILIQQLSQTSSHRSHTHFLTGARGKIQQIEGSAAAHGGGTSTRTVAPHNCRLSS